MDIYGQIAKVVKQIAGETPVTLFPAEIKSVSGDKCNILVGSLEISDVSLRAVINDNEDKVLITPSAGSRVIVADLSGGTYRNMSVVGYSEIDKVEIHIGNTGVTVEDGSVVIDTAAGRLSLKNNSQNLYSLLSELIDAITALTVTTAVGQSGTPINAASFATIKSKLGQLME